MPSAAAVQDAVGPQREHLDQLQGPPLNGPLSTPSTSAARTASLPFPGGQEVPVQPKKQRTAAHTTGRETGFLTQHRIERVPCRGFLRGS